MSRWGSAWLWRFSWLQGQGSLKTSYRRWALILARDSVSLHLSLDYWRVELWHRRCLRLILTQVILNGRPIALLTSCQPPTLSTRLGLGTETLVHILVLVVIFACVTASCKRMSTWVAVLAVYRGRLDLQVKRLLILSLACFRYRILAWVNLSSRYEVLFTRILAEPTIVAKDGDARTRPDLRAHWVSLNLCLLLNKLKLVEIVEPLSLASPVIIDCCSTCCIRWGFTP